uniref:Uncharacterized protein n=1 Tax=Geospiza parvula TaxID=87175 RepID=A0A8C3NJE9_GEOPR
SQEASGTKCKQKLSLSLMAFSFVFWAAGLTMLIIGLWAKVSLGSYLALSASGYPSAPTILLATGVAVIIWGFLGCFGAATEHRGLLRAYSAFLAAVLAAGLAAGLSALLYRQTLAQGFQEGLRRALLAYGEDDGVADALDALQRALSCCGVERKGSLRVSRKQPSDSDIFPLSKDLSLKSAPTYIFEARPVYNLRVNGESPRLAV